MKQPTTLEFRQAHLGTQGEHTAESWGERIRWIVDTFETGDTATARQESAGKKLGLSGEAVRLMYRGKSTPSGDTLAALMRAYPRVNPEWLVTGTGPRERPPANGTAPYAAGVAKAAQEMRELAAKLEKEAGVKPDAADAAAADVAETFEEQYPEHEKQEGEPEPATPPHPQKRVAGERGGGTGRQS